MNLPDLNIHVSEENALKKESLSLEICFILVFIL